MAAEISVKKEDILYLIQSYPKIILTFFLSFFLIKDFLLNEMEKNYKTTKIQLFFTIIISFQNKIIHTKPQLKKLALNFCLH